ncbi:succinylglutamate desuccinylase/aspartoacylase family protein [Planktothrix mougeotii]|uniref:Succinylglutamate desuccinylase/aspartoacylase family protein n=1 Tax=Planktothrix mougeotii LEGE 06226 TaxID=1828728 RepID=A0ABR9UIK9_9CYAN|nr:succinylglutamate desuccinylase/aspartoacylase family protein [Planktothrix mougeotii]MBE9146277.1 succinylglutamate desuccinylase/aspartoacylase family protein [Planktothrix mougeotii LEGE 06226]
MIPNIVTIPLIQLASGDRLFLQVYQFKGAKPGKKAYLQSNLHGAEISGNAVIYHLIEFLTGLDPEQLIGEIWLVPVCNPLSANQRSHHFSSGRYNPYDGKDWNRIFWDYEKTGENIAQFTQDYQTLEPHEIQSQYRQNILNQFQQLSENIKSSLGVPYREYYRYQLQSLSLDADYLIDLHSGTNYGLDYLYCFHSREESAKGFLLDYGILMNDYDGDAFDEAFMKPWLALERELKKLGKNIQFEIEAWTLELGSGLTLNPESVEKGVRGIKNYLAMKELLLIENFPLTSTPNHRINLCPKNQLKYYYSITGGMIEFYIKLGEIIHKNQKLYEILIFNKTGELPRIQEVFAESDGLIFDLARNHSVNQGEYILGVMPS